MGRGELELPYPQFALIYPGSYTYAGGGPGKRAKIAAGSAT